MNRKEDNPPNNSLSLFLSLSFTLLRHLPIRFLSSAESLCARVLIGCCCPSSNLPTPLAAGGCSTGFCFNKVLHRKGQLLRFRLLSTWPLLAIRRLKWVVLFCRCCFHVGRRIGRGSGGMGRRNEHCHGHFHSTLAILLLGFAFFLTEWLPADRRFFNAFHLETKKCEGNSIMEMSSFASSLWHCLPGPGASRGR